MRFSRIQLSIFQQAAEMPRKNQQEQQTQITQMKLKYPFRVVRVP